MSFTPHYVPMSLSTQGFKCPSPYSNNYGYLQYNQTMQNLNLNSSSKMTGITKQIDKYIFNMSEIIGKGQFSSVYKGHNSTNNKVVAIKVIETKKITQEIFQKLLDNEIQILKVLKSPRLIKFYDTFRSEKNIYVITEFFDDGLQFIILSPIGNLEEQIKKKGTLPEKEAVKILKFLVEALEELKKKQIIHRDIKPANILFSKGNPKLADFGFAICYQLPEDQKNVISGFNIGTPLYMAPESLLRNKYSYKSDIWAVGIVFYQMLIGDTPFFCQEQKELGQKIRQYQKERRLPMRNDKITISEDSKDLLYKMLEFYEDQRYDTDQIKNHPLFKENKLHFQANEKRPDFNIGSSLNNIQQKYKKNNDKEYLNENNGQESSSTNNSKQVDDIGNQIQEQPSTPVVKKEVVALKNNYFSFQLKLQ